MLKQAAASSTTTVPRPTFCWAARTRSPRRLPGEYDKASGRSGSVPSSSQAQRPTNSGPAGHDTRMEAARSRLKCSRPGLLLAVAAWGADWRLSSQRSVSELAVSSRKDIARRRQEGVLRVLFDSQVRLRLAGDNHPAAGGNVTPNPVSDFVASGRDAGSRSSRRLRRQDDEHLGALEIGQIAGANELSAQALDQCRQQSIARDPARRHCARVSGAPIGRAVVVGHDSPARSGPVWRA